MKIEWEETSELFTDELKEIVMERLFELNIKKIAKALHDLNWNEPDEPFLEVYFSVNVNKKLPSDEPVYIRGEYIGNKSRVFYFEFSTYNSESFTIEVIENDKEQLLFQGNKNEEPNDC
jgi:hypothetical protein